MKKLNFDMAHFNSLKELTEQVANGSNSGKLFQSINEAPSVNEAPYAVFLPWPSPGISRKAPNLNPTRDL